MIGDQVSEPLPVSFGGLLRSLRTAAGLTQEELAEAARVSYRSISDLERGVSRFPRLSTARLLADALGLSGDDRERFEAAARGHSPAAGNLVPQPAFGKASPEWPLRIGVIPVEADCYQERGSLYQQLNVPVSGERQPTAPSGRVLTGIGGAGKTQLAARYCRDLWQEQRVDLIVWITGRHRDEIVSAYARAAAEILGADPANPLLAAGQFLTFLEVSSIRWLLVLDDLLEPSVMSGLWPTSHPTGQLIVTTRRADAALIGSNRIVVKVGLFTIAQAVDYLMASLAARDRSESRDEIAGLAADLGFLPLALAQAAAFMADSQITCTAYRRMLRDSHRRLLDLFPQDSSLPDDHRATLAATWLLSVEYADGLRPCGTARPMLELAAMLDPNGVPSDVLTSAPAVAYLGEYPSPQAQDDAACQGAPSPGHEATSEDAAGALQCLRRLSLAEVTDGVAPRAVAVHALIQRATRDYMSSERRDAAVLAAANALVATWPGANHGSELGTAFRANASILIEQAGATLWRGGAHPVLFRLGQGLGISGLHDSAVAYFDAMRKTAESRLGAEHVDTLMARGWRIHWHGDAGQVERAAADCAELLADQVRILGPDHEQTLYWRQDLARWRAEAGDVAGAIAAFRDVLADRERLLGPDHRDTLFSRYEIAWWHGYTGDFSRAIAEFRQLLADRERVLGADDADTLTSRYDLAALQGEAGDPQAAVAGISEVVADRSRVLGPDHPQTLMTRNEIARWRAMAGDPARAVTELEAVLADRLRVLGPNHRDTLITRFDLAAWRGSAGDPAGAAAGLREVLADRLRVLGPNHRDTLITRNVLARWRGESGDPAGAVADLEALLADRLRLLGPDNRYTLITRLDIGQWRGRSGDLVGAIEMLEALLADQVRILGPDHPDTTVTRAELEIWKNQLDQKTRFSR